ncbi:ArsR family transcriptional regulator [Massilia sp. Root418]|uniref:ArsR/SmtB family transcription factor n=1 Tax=Massilia sp. Root418 TaxID=1736532 RepID=UPI0006F2131A|nr:helix-turn-helix transcriptional regulator [Massilia sp. Root418]KQW89968.1 ArsR family transcriptional regulator [Massilia sp. Root418]
MDTKHVLAALAALAQESRLAAFRLLVQAGPDGLAASKIAGRLDMAPSSLSFHLKELAHAGLIAARQDGRYVIYSASFDTMNGLLAFLTENCCGGVPCVPAAGATACCEPATTIKEA